MLIAVLAVHSTAVFLIKNTQNLVETAVLLRFVMTVSKKISLKLLSEQIATFISPTSLTRALVSLPEAKNREPE